VFNGFAYQRHSDAGWPIIGATGVPCGHLLDHIVIQMEVLWGID
jgi:hypothetical protein